MADLGSERGTHLKYYVKNPGKSGRMYLVDNKTSRWFLAMRMPQEDVEDQKSVKHPPLGNHCITMVLALVSVALL